MTSLNLHYNSYSHKSPLKNHPTKKVTKYCSTVIPALSPWIALCLQHPTFSVKQLQNHNITLFLFRNLLFSREMEVRIFFFFPSFFFFFFWEIIILYPAFSRARGFGVRNFSWKLKGKMIIHDRVCLFETCFEF